MGIVRLFGAFVAATLITLILASFVHTHFVIAGLRDLGVAVPLPLALETAGRDLLGLAPGLGPVIAVALLLGFLVAALALRFVTLPRAVAFALAGGVAMGTALLLMKLPLEVTLLASARSWAGFLSLCASAALGGFVFARGLPPRRRLV